jgi:hypothetical protein
VSVTLLSGNSGLWANREIGGGGTANVRPYSCRLAAAGRPDEHDAVPELHRVVQVNDLLDDERRHLQTELGVAPDDAALTR